jgi:myo-inositol 2-dehydrogenase / D-chiro-inositol 1-dehydrogenase
MAVSVRIGVIGAGVMGATHIRILAREVHGAVVAAVADVDEARATAVAGEAGGARVHAEPADLVRDPEVDAVIVASSDATHEAFVLACLEAGKPVLCEKPLAATADSCVRVLDAEAALGRRLVQVGFMRRFDPGYTALKAAVVDGSIGAPLLLHCVHRNASVPPAYTSEMLVTSSAVHEIDVARWLLDDEIVRASVYAGRSTTTGGGRLRDPQMVVLETAGGVLVDVEVFATAAYGYDIRCELVGETGTAALSPPRPVEIRRAGHEGAAVPIGFSERFAEAYRRELQAWVDGVPGERTDGPSAWDGYAASAVAEACLASLADGGPRDVELAPRPSLYERETVVPAG